MAPSLAKAIATAVPKLLEMLRCYSREVYCWGAG